MKKILLIEQNQGIRQNISELLRDIPSFVIELNNSSEAFETIKFETPDLIIASIYGIKPGGLDLLKESRSGITTCDIPFILLSVMPQEEEKKRIESFGKAMVISKPVNPDELIKLVKSF